MIQFINQTNYVDFQHIVEKQIAINAMMLLKKQSHNDSYWDIMFNERDFWFTIFLDIPIISIPSEPVIYIPMFLRYYLQIFDSAKFPF